MQSRSTYSSRLQILDTGRVDILRRLKGFGRRRFSLPLRLALREVAAEYRLQRLHRAGVRKARRMHWDAPLKLNLGCDANVKAGWVNIDLFKATADIRLDLREPLPFPDNSAACIYSEHVFEHLAYPCIHDAMGWTVETPGAPSEAMQLLRESRRVLIPGGVFSIGVPDAERAVAQYAGREFERWGPPWVDTPMHFLNYVFRQGRDHKYAYDEETLGRLLSTAGFVDVRRRVFDSRLDSAHRMNDTLYMEARKPLGQIA
jgi:predicted SAM-dependent methyltransferase